jgi:hypothetical protein
VWDHHRQEFNNNKEEEEEEVIPIPINVVVVKGDGVDNKKRRPQSMATIKKRLFQLRLLYNLIVTHMSFVVGRRRLRRLYFVETTTTTMISLNIF